MHERSSWFRAKLQIVAIKATLGSDVGRWGAGELVTLRDFRRSSYASGRMKNGVRKEERTAPQLRGERVVEKILEATLEEMALKGFNGLSMEDVAERAGVAKTTVYRR